MTVETRRCTKCKEVRPVEEFAWRIKAKGKRLAQCKACRAAHMRCHYGENKERILARKRRHYGANKEGILAQCKHYDDTHKDENATTRRRWCKANPDKMRRNGRRRRAHKNGADGSHTDAEFMAKVETCDWICPSCGIEMTMPERDRSDGSKPTDLTEDHIVPLSKGGSDGISNIRPLCRSCNSGKCDRILATPRENCPGVQGVV